MSAYGRRESFDSNPGMDLLLTGHNYTGENTCQRIYYRLLNCLRESQELDVNYDCRSRLLDLRECTVHPKQSIWAMRETMVGIQHERELRQWLKDYDEEMGHPPLLEAVATVRKKVEAEGGLDILNPTVFHDPDLFIPRNKADKV